ncbi:hypothetical protein DUI87_15831 [Hirundo rustica rustica]|uniref:Rna-directed dna polymerase from mobile element jockey-like n=1 Tax=Hirundo rustica rustica TaxID=333673 RepID=A0A3M0KGY9_HIRRU|nr:hypothetical protein DUI87_15831 [Hirundo rustica rustica]
MDNGIESALTNPCGAVDTLEGREPFQSELDRLGSWACANLMKFNKAKCKILHVGQERHKQKYRLEKEQIKSSPEEKDLGLLLDEKFSLRHPEGHLYPGLSGKQCGQQRERGDSLPLLCPRLLCSALLCSALVKLHLECCVQVWGSQRKKDGNLSEHVQRRVTGLLPSPVKTG